MRPPLLLLSLSACTVFELRVNVEVPAAALASWDPSWPLAVTTSRRGEVLVRSVECVPGEDISLQHVWRQRGGCAVPEALLVRIEEARLAGDAACDFDAPVDEVVALAPPIELYWERGAQDDCVRDGGGYAAEVTVAFPTEE